MDEIKKPYFPGSISYKQLGLLIFVFILGLAGNELVHNILIEKNITFSTIGLLSFILGVILSGASIVLAITAIVLGKTSEYSMIQRSDESIRLQNEVFVKTTDALQRIESSTGVTEKRIEDIISGRVGDISHKIVDLALEDKGKPGINREKLEEQIRESILRELKEPRLGEDERKKLFEEEDKKRQLRLKRYLNYKKYQEKVFALLANLGGLKAVKIGDGSYEGSGDDLFDCIFIKDDKKIGISVLEHDAITEQFDRIKKFLFSISDELVKQNVSEVFLIVDAKSELKGDIEKLIMEPMNVVSEKIKGLIKLVVGDIDEVGDLIIYNVV